MKIEAEPLILDTHDLPEKNRFQFWSDFIARRVLGMAMQTVKSPDYMGRIEVHGLQNACVVFALGDSCSSARGREEITRTTSEAPDWLLMRVNIPTRIEHCGRDESLKAGDLILIDARRPYKRADSRIDYTVLAMPDTLLRDWGATFDNCAGRSFPSEQGWARLLSAHMAGLSPDLMRSASKHGALNAMFTKSLVSMLVQMLAQECPDAISAAAEDSRTEQGRKNLYDLMLLWIREHHSDPQVTAMQLAKAFEVSLRYVHKLFAAYSAGRGFLGYLQNMRIEHAEQLLGSKRDAALPVSDISWRCGFADASSFGRLFKLRHGMTPGAYRNLHLQNNSESEDLQ